MKAEDEKAMQAMAIRHFGELTEEFGLQVATSAMQGIGIIADLAGAVAMEAGDEKHGQKFIEEVKRILTETDQEARTER